MSTTPAKISKISAFIITKNEEMRITNAIKSIQDVVDEIIVVDSGSTDNTVKIATTLGAKVVHNDWPGYTKQKTFAEALCSHSWVLNIDADEELSESLQHEIGEIFRSNVQDRYKGYTINCTIVHRCDTKLKLRWFAPSNRVLRLYHRDFASFGNHTNFSTQDSVRFNTGVDQRDAVYDLQGPVFHYSVISLEQLVAKGNFYTSEQAKDMIANQRIPSKARVISEFFFCFFKTFLLRRYWVFGYNGFVDSLTESFLRFLRMAKTRELKET